MRCKKLTIQTFTRHAHNYYMYESKIITILIILSRYKKKKNDIHGLKIRSNFFFISLNKKCHFLISRYLWYVKREVISMNKEIIMHTVQYICDLNVFFFFHRFFLRLYFFHYFTMSNYINIIHSFSKCPCRGWRIQEESICILTDLYSLIFYLCNEYVHVIYPQQFHI